MAYGFSATTDKISVNAPDFGTGDMTIAMRFNTSSVVQFAQLIGNETASSTGFSLLINASNSSSGDIRFFLSTSGQVVSATTLDWSDGEWHNVCLTRSGNNFAINVDAIERGTGTSSLSMNGSANLIIGRNDIFSPRNLVGNVAEVGIWTGVALNQGEIDALFKGFPCRRIRPQNLVRYLPLVRNVADLARGATTTATGGFVATHPRVYA